MPSDLTGGASVITSQTCILEVSHLPTIRQCKEFTVFYLSLVPEEPAFPAFYWFKPFTALSITRSTH